LLVTYVESVKYSKNFILNISPPQVPFLTAETVGLFKAEISSRKAQELLIEVWDWDPGFPGYMNDDYLGR
jgi:hypothetical protein